MKCFHLESKYCFTPLDVLGGIKPTAPREMISDGITATTAAVATDDDENIKRDEKLILQEI